MGLKQLQRHTGFTTLACFSNHYFVGVNDVFSWLLGDMKEVVHEAHSTKHWKDCGGLHGKNMQPECTDVRLHHTISHTIIYHNYCIIYILHRLLQALATKQQHHAVSVSELFSATFLQHHKTQPWPLFQEGTNQVHSIAMM